MSEMIERVARAMLADELKNDGDPFNLGETVDSVWDGEADIWLRYARAAIAEMRELTDLMGLGLPADYRPGSHSAGDIWRSLIDAALKDDG